MIPDVPNTWHDSFTANETKYLATLLVEMNAFFSKAENLMSGFDITQALSNKGANVNFGFVLEAAVETGLIQLQYDRLKLTLRGFQTASIGDIEAIGNVISMYIIADKMSEDAESYDTPY